MAMLVVLVHYSRFTVWDNRGKGTVPAVVNNWTRSSGDVRLLVIGGLQRGHDRALAFGVLVQEAENFRTLIFVIDLTSIYL